MAATRTDSADSPDVGSTIDGPAASDAGDTPVDDDEWSTMSVPEPMTALMSALGVIYLWTRPRRIS